MFEKLLSHNQSILLIDKFLRSLYVGEADVKEDRYITWLELYILYRITGNGKPVSDISLVGDKVKQSVPLDVQLRHFKTQVRCISVRTLVGGRDQHIFKPAAITQPNLIGVGLDGKHQAVSFNVSINNSTQRIVNKALILLGRNLSRDKVNLILDEHATSGFSLACLCFKGKVGWDSRLDVERGSLEPVNGTHFLEDSEASSSGVIESRREMHIVICPSCKQQTPSQQYKFQCRDLDIKIKCLECFKPTPIKAWSCNCGVLWHTCKVHTCTAESMPTPRSKPKSSSSSSKEDSSKEVSKGHLQANSSFDELLDDDLKREAMKAKKSSGQKTTSTGVYKPYELKASLLSPHLREKFAHLLS